MSHTVFRKVCVTLIVLIVISYSGLSFLFPDAIFYDAATASLVNSIQFSSGYPLYHGVEASISYSLLYGPMMIIPGAVFQWLGFGTAGYTIVCMMIWLAVFAGWYALIREKAARLAMISGAVWSVTGSAMGFLPREDGMLILLTLLAAYCANRRWVIFFSLCVAWAINIKLHAALYFIPFLALFFERHWTFRQWVYGTCAGCVGLILPFTLPGVSVSGYIDWLALSGHHSFTVTGIYAVFGIFVFVVIPALCFVDWKGVNLRRDYFGMLIVLCFLVLIVPSSKVGASGYHVYPLLTAMFLWIARAPEKKRDEAGETRVLAFSMFFLLSVGGLKLYDRATWALAFEKMSEELNVIADSSGGWSNVSIIPGATTSVSRNFVAYALERGAFYVGNDVQMWDLAASGIDVSKMMLSRIEECNESMRWVVGRGETPFSELSPYTNKPLFTGVTEAFMSKFTLTELGGDGFDVWKCVAY